MRGIQLSLFEAAAQRGSIPSLALQSFGTRRAHRILSNTRTPPELRFWLQVNFRREGCWPWIGGRDRDGYGRLWAWGEKVMAHRLAWRLSTGPIPEGLCVLHRCDHPPCVRPDHLFLGTQRENLEDRDLKGRAVVPIRRNGRWTGEVRCVRTPTPRPPKEKA